MSIRSLIAVLALGTALPAVAQQVVQPVPTLSISAEGRSLRAPDVADLSGGVVTTAATASAAMTQNAARMTAVVAAVRRAGIAERDIQTAGINLEPQYKYEQNQPPLLTGYQATNTVNLRIRKLADAGRLIDALIASGANQISGPNFRVDDSAAALDEARLKAVATATARANLYAKAAGVKIKRIISISESGGYDTNPRPMMLMRAEKSDAMSTPVSPGEITLSVILNMSFEIE